MVICAFKNCGGVTSESLSEVAETLNHLKKQSEKLPEGTTIRWKGLEAMLQWKKGR